MNTVEIAPRETEVSTPLEVPEIPVVESPYDMFEANRQNLIKVLESGTKKQAHGTWYDTETGASCILQLAFDEVRGK